MVPLDEEFRQCTKDIMVISAHSPRVMADVVGHYEDGRVIAEFRTPLFGKRPDHLIVRVQGTRLNSERWPRFTQAQEDRNNAFWGAATTDIDG